MRNWRKSLKMDKSRKSIFFAVTLLFIAAAIMGLCLGVVPLTPSQLIKAIREGAGSSFEGNIFWYARLPRTAACLLSGAGLAVAGAVIQGVLANKLASPSIIGVNAGAGLAVTICCACGAISGWAIAGSAFFGAFIVVIVIALTAQKTGASRTTVVLGGVAVNSFLNAASEAIRTLYPDVGVISADFRVGGFSAVTSARVFPAGVLIMIGLAVVLTLCNELDLLSLGEEAAQGLGLSVKRMRTVFFLLAALLAGASVSFAGLLGFVGLIVPHIGRRLVGGESRYLIPFCALGGASFVTLCDLVGRLLFQPYEISAGILMAFIGGPFFLFLLLNSKGGHRRD
ncbi:FecCD family ABC transporter permease [Frisingicoccus sp.]|uniref:FecCD family ABC transporter permease n=1 Tax=Frisingicoccus sp. TaxID=1918627 RepID=UPI003868D65A